MYLVGLEKTKFLQGEEYNMTVSGEIWLFLKKFRHTRDRQFVDYVPEFFFGAACQMTLNKQLITSILLLFAVDVKCSLIEISFDVQI